MIFWDFFCLPGLLLVYYSLLFCVLMDLGLYMLVCVSVSLCISCVFSFFFFMLMCLFAYFFFLKRENEGLKFGIVGE